MTGPIMDIEMLPIETLENWSFAEMKQQCTIREHFIYKVLVGSLYKDILYSQVVKIREKLWEKGPEPESQNESGE